MLPRVIEVQGHRGAAGLASENTLPSFELALDLGVASIETDLVLSADDQPVLLHDFHLTRRLCSALPPDAAVPVRALTLAELRTFRIDCRPARTTAPLAEAFAQERGIDPCAIPTLAELFAFVDAYAGAPGRQVGKSSRQQRLARTLILDLELKREPFRPHLIGDGFDGTAPATLEKQVMQAIRQTGVLERCRVRSFDHRSVRAVMQLEPTLQTGILLYNTLPAQVGPLLASAGAGLYGADYLFVDAELVRQVHAAGARILPYTVNDPAIWERLLDWGVDGVTTDYPDRLLAWLEANGWPL